MIEKSILASEKLYYADSHLWEFDATVISCADCGDTFEVVLDKTAFFPEGGGQYGDKGYIDSVEVLDTKEKDGQIIHITTSPLCEGASYHARLDASERFDKMQQHTAEHIISGLVNKIYGYNNVGFHLGPERTTLDFDGALDAVQIAEIELQANEAVFSNIPVKAYIPTKDEESLINYRSKIEIDGDVRLVEIPGYDICACCAPHVKTTGEIGLIKIIDSVAYKGGTRLTMLAGYRALTDYKNMLNQVSRLSNLLSVPKTDVAAAAEKLIADSNTLRYEIIKVQEDALNLEIDDIINGSSDGIALKISDQIDMNVARRFVNNLVDKGARVAAIFVRMSEDEYRYIIGSKEIDLKEKTPLINASLNASGGGKPNMIQGSSRAAESDILEKMKEIFA